MKTVILTVEQRAKYRNRLTNVFPVYDRMVNKANSVLFEYAKAHNGLAQELVHPNVAQEKKELLKVEVKQVCQTHMIEAIQIVKDIKSEYLAEVMPIVDMKQDMVELTLLEKEIAILSDEEFIKYYEENWLDNVISRLCALEIKRRGLPNPMLAKDSYSDDLTKTIDEQLRMTLAIERSVNNMLILPKFAGETKIGVNSPIQWDFIFRQIELVNQGGLRKVTLADLQNPNFGKEYTPIASV